jgi:hypothetical protein
MIVCSAFLVEMALVTPCVASYCCECGDYTKDWDLGQVITVNIKRSAAQVWHPIGRTVTLQANGVDWDIWMYNCGCYGWNYIGADRALNYSWSPSDHLSQPATGTEVEWCAKEKMSAAETITVSVNDDGTLSELNPGDTGCRDDPSPATASVNLGAFDVKASLTVSGTNRTPFTMYAWWSEHDESLHYGDPEWVEAEPLFDVVSLAGGPISLGVPDYDDTNIIDASTLFPTITFRAEWVLSSEPDDKWREDQEQVAGCWVDRDIDGTLNSEAWDEDVDLFLDDYVAFTPSLPDFHAPISWDWDRIIWDLIALAGAGTHAEGATGMGMVFQSDFFAGTNNWQNHSDVKHQSKDHTFTSETPNSKTTTMSYGPSGEWWQFDVSVEGGNSVELRGDIQGKIEIVETTVETMVFPGPILVTEYVNAYAKAWSEGLIGFWLDEPYYAGTPYPPDSGYVP